VAIRLRPLQIDFRRQGASWPWAAPLLALVAFGFAADVGLSYVKTLQVIEKGEKQIARLDPRRAKPVKNASQDEIAAARETAQRLSTPWTTLFAALEQAATDQVTLLSIEPDPKAGTVVISGDSKDYLATLSYVLSLSNVGALNHVQLLRHEVKATEPQKPVGFSISASWQDDRS